MRLIVTVYVRYEFLIIGSLFHNNNNNSHYHNNNNSLSLSESRAGNYITSERKRRVGEGGNMSRPQHWGELLYRHTLGPSWQIICIVARSVQRVSFLILPAFSGFLGLLLFCLEYKLHNPESFRLCNFGISSLQNGKSQVESYFQEMIKHANLQHQADVETPHIPLT